MKIFVALGTYPKQFDRLLKEIDSLLESKKLKADVFAQTGVSVYKPKHFKFKDFLSPKEYEKELKNADIVLAHSGAGTIITALKHKKPVVVVPRREKFSEHTDDHQLDIAKAMHSAKKCIAVFELKDLFNALKKAEKFRPEMESNKKQLVKRLNEFLKEVE